MKLNNPILLRCNIFNNYINNFILNNNKLNYYYLIYNIYINNYIKNNNLLILYIYLYNYIKYINIKKINFIFYYKNIVNLIFNISINFFIKFYYIKNINLNEFYILNLIKYYLEKKINIKKIIKQIYLILSDYKNIKGFKLIIKGRFKESLRKIKKNFNYGKLYIQTFNSNTYKYNSFITLSYGIIGIKLIISKL